MPSPSAGTTPTRRPQRKQIQAWSGGPFRATVQHKVGIMVIRTGA